MRKLSWQGCPGGDGRRLAKKILYSNFLLGKPPALPGDSQRLTFPGIDISIKIRKPPSCEPVKVEERGGFQWTTSRV
jgi:hypothetical protein